MSSFQPPTWFLWVKMVAFFVSLMWRPSVGSLCKSSEKSIWNDPSENPHEMIHTKIHIKTSIPRLLLLHNQLPFCFFSIKRNRCILAEGSELTRGSFKESQLTKAKTWPEASQVFFSEADTLDLGKEEGWILGGSLQVIVSSFIVTPIFRAFGRGRTRSLED